ncbi:hypothetical protein I4U23_030385 [Adineta vaga]|nr:hypothetical protein I4U23_030385 [Adineta vaga]
MNVQRPRTAQNHRNSLLPNSSNNTSQQLSTIFSSDEGCQLLSTVINDEYKLLQDTKKILEERLNLDKLYAKNLQELTAKADRITWPTETNSIATACHELLMQWSHRATIIDSNADQFRRTAQIDVGEAEKRYLNEAKLFVAKNSELSKISEAARNDNRIVSLTLREYNSIDEQHVRKVHNLLVYYEEVQLILNRQWQSVLEFIANYKNDNVHNSLTSNENLQQLYSIDPRHCYDELCKIHSNIPLLTTKPIVFNELLLQTSGLSNLEVDRIFVDDTTSDSVINVLRQKVRTLTDEVNRANMELSAILQVIDQIRDKETTYQGRKSYFEQEQQADNLRMKIIWMENLKNDLQETFDDSPDSDDTLLHQELLMALSDRLEDQAYFHGLMPRVQSVDLLVEKGDYLIRLNDQGKIVLSILWTDPKDQSKLKDGHFFIHEKDSMYYFQMNGIGKSSVPKLIVYYTRQRLELRDDGTRLVRPIEKPNYVIHNDEITLFENIGSGHFGDVTRGEYRKLPVAVKVLRSETNVLSPIDRESFVNEALVLKRYKHKRIVNFIGIAAYREPMMIVMELVEQGSLSNYLKKNELRPPQLTQMCYEIAKGMAYLESYNVIHRDLAARNCLVDKNGRVKVADFGLSRCLQDDEEYFTQRKEFPVRWWAVEVLSRGPYTTKADVWSYGITAWEIFSKATLPYAHIAHNHLVSDAVKRGERLKRPDKCPANMYQIMTESWSFNPKDRPAFKDIVEVLRKERSILSIFPFFNSSK